MEKQASEISPEKHAEVNAGKDVSNSVIIAGDGNTVTLGDGSMSKKNPSPAKPKPKRTRKAKKGKIDQTVLVALIGVIGTIVAALIGSPLAEKIFPVEATSPPIVAENTPMGIEAPTNTPGVTAGTSPEVISTASLTLESAISPTAEVQVEQMYVVLLSTAVSGKIPLKVNFDARTSYVKFVDGSLSACGTNRFCSYDFFIYRNSNLEQKISSNEGVLSYTFGQKGRYFVTVYVCRGETCGDDGVTLDVK